MLQRAITRDELSIYIWQDTSLYKGRLYCPHCKSKVTARKGKLKAHHFAHDSLKECPYSNKESAEHLGMKKNLFNSLTKRYSAVQIDLEKSVVPNRIADMIIHGEKDLIVEFQASPIKFSEIQSRTKDYNKGNYPVLWIFHVGRFSNAKGTGAFPGEASVPYELLMMAKLESLFIMNNEGVIKRCVIGKKRTKTRYFLKFFNVSIEAKNVFKFNEVFQWQNNEWIYLCQLGKDSIYSKKNLYYGYWLLRNTNITDNKFDKDKVKSLIARKKEVLPLKTFAVIKRIKWYNTHAEFYLFVRLEQGLNSTKDFIIMKESLGSKEVLEVFGKFEALSQFRLLKMEFKEVAASIESIIPKENNKEKQDIYKDKITNTKLKIENQSQSNTMRNENIDKKTNENSQKNKGNFFLNVLRKFKKFIR
ncbi:competence protein CoiA [Priestia megaterium]|uniref:competence protein CoiA n=1 Tax=Priestia megaterium TaxID=1404 RepID=UPI00234E8312|nr:competence protein CoiA family protein [Priestia megaterium]MDC7783928.1 competence protein CoiA family protein [Priestia megaterium]